MNVREQALPGLLLVLDLRQTRLLRAVGGVGGQTAPRTNRFRCSALYVIADR